MLAQNNIFNAPVFPQNPAAAGINALSHFPNTQKRLS